MPEKPVCRLTHSLIASGECPWCQQPVIDGAVRPEVPRRDVAVRHWNIPAMLRALDSPDADVRANVSGNLLHHGPDLEQAIPVLRKALQGSEGELRLALSALDRKGGHLTLEEAERWEQKVSSHPDDVVLRLLLLGYYFLAASTREAARQARHRHALWIIEHAPHLATLGGPKVDLHPSGDGEAVYQQAKNLWLRHLQDDGNNITLLDNAARFFVLSDPALAETLLRKGAELEPDNPHWAERLGHLYSLRGRRAGPGAARENAARAFVELERALSLKKDEQARFWLLPDLAQAALAAGQNEKARAYAEEMLRQAERPDYFFHKDGDAIHHGHLVLGLLALIAGDIAKAKEHLLESAKTKGSPVLGSFGPRLTLAEALLERGERATVVRYLRLCTAFWQTPDQCAEQWIHTIEHGGIPEFSKNLLG